MRTFGLEASPVLVVSRRADGSPRYPMPFGLPRPGFYNRFMREQNATAAHFAWRVETGLASAHSIAVCGPLARQ